MNTVYDTVHTSPTTELVWITPKAKRDVKDKPYKHGGNQDLGQSAEAATQGFPEVGGMGRDS